jgi:general secretion pathway protein G
MVMKNDARGFTIVELLIVVVIIAILAAVTVVAYNGMRARTYDSRRAQDLANIRKALLAYEVINGGVPRTAGTSPYTEGINYAGWDSSTSPNWLAFLRPTNGFMPVDPTNTITAANNPPDGGNRNYFYHCYLAGTGNLPATANVSIGYHKQNDALVRVDYAVASCLSS